MMVGVFSKSKGRALVLLAAALPMMLLLALGAVEVSRAISVNSTLVQFTREAGNLTSRGTEVNRSLKAAIAATSPTLHDNNKQQWKVIYSQLRKQSGDACSAKTCLYQVESQVELGDLKGQSHVGAAKKPVIIAGMDKIEPNRIFHSIEVFYDYRPEFFSLVSKLIDLKFYEKTVYTDLAALR
ncbi:MAG: TadE/TadG family type IV pilus assembly protein [Candidatus Binatia bacterium]